MPRIAPIHRAPGYPVPPRESFKWPNLNLVPPLQLKLPSINFTPVKNESQVAKLKGELYKIKNPIIKQYLIDFCNRFYVELRRESRIASMQSISQYVSLKSTILAEHGNCWWRLRESDINEINKMLEGHIKHLKSKKPIRNYRDYDRSIALKSGPIFKFIKSLFTRENIIFIAQEYFGYPMKVEWITLHICTPQDVHYKQVFSDIGYSTRLNNLHFDPKAGTIKCILYLNDVGEGNGAFKYISQSHRFRTNHIERIAAKANCTTNYLDCVEARKAFMLLPENLRKTSIFGAVTDDSDPVSNYYLEREIAFTSKEGNLILFDPALCHRGGICEEGERISLQIAIRPVKGID